MSIKLCQCVLTGCVAQLGSGLLQSAVTIAVPHIRVLFIIFHACSSHVLGDLLVLAAHHFLLHELVAYAYDLISHLAF